MSKALSEKKGLPLPNYRNVPLCSDIARFDRGLTWPSLGVMSEKRKMLGSELYNAGDPEIPE